MPPPPGPWRAVSSILLTLAGFYLLLVILVFVTQERLLFIPFGEVVATPATVGLDFEEVEITTSDGERLHGWFVPHPEPRGVLLFFHGNAGNISHRLESIALFHRLRLEVFIFDYRGYGRSSGRPGEDGSYRDAEAAWGYLVDERGIEPERIVLFGRSMGAAIAARQAAAAPPGGVILESAVTSVADIGAELYPFLPVRLLARLRYETASHLAHTDRPVLIIHSRDDEIIPFHHGQRLLAAAGGPARLLEIRGDHNTGFLRSGRLYTDGIDRFLGEYLD